MTTKAAQAEQSHGPPWGLSASGSLWSVRRGGRGGQGRTRSGRGGQGQVGAAGTGRDGQGQAGASREREGRAGAGTGEQGIGKDGQGPGGMVRGGQGQAGANRERAGTGRNGQGPEGRGRGGQGRAGASKVLLPPSLQFGLETSEHRDTRLTSESLSLPHRNVQDFRRIVLTVSSICSSSDKKCVQNEPYNPHPAIILILGLILLSQCRVTI